MLPTLSFIKESFDRFNRQIFREPLPEITIRMTRAGSSVGKFSFPRRLEPSRDNVRHCKLTFSANFDLPREEWEDVIIHEMLHYSIWFNKIRDTGPHGVTFKRLMNDINRIHGRHLTVRHKTEPGAETADRRVRLHIICITDWKDGRRLISVMSKGQMASFHHELKKRPDLKQWGWYVSSDPYFNKYPHVRSMKFYRMPDTDKSKLNSLLDNEIQSFSN